MGTFYITTTLPYVNAAPHIGFAKEILEADVIARFHRLRGEEVVFNTGTDEHGLKIFRKAQEAGKTPQEYCDEYAAKFAQLKDLFQLTYTNFIRTTDPAHKAAAQEFWRRCAANGDIYKKNYQVKYCVGCELEKLDSELVEGRCPLHPNLETERIEEENYFFRFSAYQQPLLDWYAQHPQFVRPEQKMKEIVSFVSRGLQDFSISRQKAKMPWGVPVPGDDEQVMYVWFDALVNYISTLGWPNNEANFRKFWPGVQVAGKDNLRQQSAMWQAMLLSAQLPPSAQILINGFISVGGQKMSKSLGNVISPTEMVNRYGSDGTRFLLLSLGSYGGDIDVTWERFDTLYTAELSNGLGNLCSRVAKMAQKAGLPGSTAPSELRSEFQDRLLEYSLHEGLDLLLQMVRSLDGYLSEKKPWTITGAEQAEVLQTALQGIVQIAFHLSVYMPETSRKILTHFTAEKVIALAPLFPRLEQRAVS